jgi:hypothetical protein
MMIRLSQDVKEGVFQTALRKFESTNLDAGLTGDLEQDLLDLARKARPLKPVTVALHEKNLQARLLSKHRKLVVGFSQLHIYGMAL